MWLVWTGGNDRLWDALSSSLRNLRSAEDDLVGPGLPLQPRQPLDVFRPRNEPCFDKPTRPDPAVSASGSTAARRLRARSVRERREISRRQVRRARQRRICRSAPTTANRPASSACGCSRIRISTRRRAGDWDPEAYYNDRSTTSRRTWCGRTASACRAASATSGPARSTRRPTREPDLGEPELAPSARSISGSIASSSGTSDTAQLHLPAAPHLRARHARYVAGLDRQHQQSADDERDLHPRRAARDAQAVGPGELLTGGQLEQQAVQRLPVNRTR